MDANERYEKIKELMVRREGVVNSIDNEIAALFGDRASSTSSTRVCGNCGIAGHNSKTCTKEKGTTLSVVPIV